MNAIEKAKELIRDYEVLSPTTDRAETLPLLRLLVECEDGLSDMRETIRERDNSRGELNDAYFLKVIREQLDALLDKLRRES